ncbi:hypothetical protein QEH56_21800 [Pelagicoccus enzymogenes]|uniref:hypothetical protein n=1 Tax=Pelagicoccus enzymogenes TaxID=2773457 RepID=UPI00281002C0|nr:hypothetical protein [Pelagicoccus enzymogenes]MDQ8200817.1 hypothetical protein [Pelagicoccus enzymogenes]
MNRIACMLSLFALALNVAMGYSGSVLFCEHASGDSHLVSRGEHAFEVAEKTCHDHDSILLLDPSVQDCCDTCIDVEIGGDDLKDLQRSSGQDRISAPTVVSVEFAGFDLDEHYSVASASLLPASRAPPCSESLTRLQLKRTVLRI